MTCERRSCFPCRARKLLENLRDEMILETSGEEEERQELLSKVNNSEGNEQTQAVYDLINFNQRALDHKEALKDSI